MKKAFLILAFATIMFEPSNAQTCAGEVIQFRETFGTGFGRAPLVAGRTNYIYNGTSSLADGQYTLRNNTQGRPEWHNVPDHTGNTNGRMMVTNASYTPGEFYRDTVFGLTSTSTYSVYFYAMNVNTPGTCSPNPILPRLELVIESYNADGTFTQLSSIISDSLPQTNPAEWIRISGTYYLPINVTAVRYRIINNSTGGCGNDVAIDDITFSQCQPTVLPITGLSLKARKKQSGVSLDWTLKSNEFTAFDVERSVDAGTWTLVKKVVASLSKTYTIDDTEVIPGEVQYRIAAIHANGTRSYSNIFSIREEQTAIRLAAFPNPFQNEFSLQFNAEDDKPNTLVRLFDLQGRPLAIRNWNIKHGDNRFSFGTLNIPPSIYFVCVTDNNGTVIARQQLIKND